MKMRTFILPVASLAALSFGAGAALAASPTYCALYAREFVKHARIDSQEAVSTDRTHDRAYHKCLNMDDEPILPTAYFDAETDGVGGPFVADEGAGDSGTMAAAEPDPQPVKQKESSRKWRGSGLPAGSPELRAWCEEHFPNSYDPDTGTVLPYDTGVRTKCR